MLIWLLAFVCRNVLSIILLIIGRRPVLAIARFIPSCMEIPPIGSVSSNAPLRPSTPIIPKDSAWLPHPVPRASSPSIPQDSALKSAQLLLTSLAILSHKYASQPVRHTPQFSLQIQSPASVYPSVPQPRLISPKTQPKNAF